MTDTAVDELEVDDDEAELESTSSTSEPVIRINRRVIADGSATLGEGRKLKVRTTTNTFAISYTKKIKRTYYSDSQETKTVEIPQEFYPLLLDLLQQVVERPEDK